MPEGLTEVIAPLVAAAAIVWVATEGIGRAFKVKKEYLALVFGPVTGVMMYRLGFLAIGETNVYWAYGMAAFFGLLATFTADYAHTKVKGGR
jgi:hypothetical protein